MAVNPAYGARNKSAQGPGRVYEVKGLSALDLVIEAGLLPYSAGPVEFAAWLRAPVDEIVDDLTILVTPIVNSVMAPYMVTIGQAVTDAEQAALDAQGFAEAASASADDALGYRDQAQQIVDDFEAVAPVKATASEILAGTDDAKFITPKGFRDVVTPNTVTFTATPVPSFANTQGWEMVMTANVTAVGAPTGCKKGETYAISFIEDGTGGRTLPASGSWDAAYDWGEGGIPSFVTGANKRNILFGYCYQESPVRLSINRWRSA